MYMDASLFVIIFSVLNSSQELYFKQTCHKIFLGETVQVCCMTDITPFQGEIIAERNSEK